MPSHSEIMNSLQSCLRDARWEAGRLNAAAIAPAHLLVGLLEDPDDELVRFLALFHRTPRDLRGRLPHPKAAVLTTADDRLPNDLPYTPAARSVLTEAVGIASSLGHTEIAPVHLLLALALAIDTDASTFLVDLGLDAHRLRPALRAWYGDPAALAAIQAEARNGPA